MNRRIAPCWAPPFTTRVLFLTCPSMEVDPAEYTLSVQAPGYASSSDTLTLGRGKGPRMAKSIALAADASRLASLLHLAFRSP